MSQSKYQPIKLVPNPISPFPDFIDFKITEPIAEQLKQSIGNYINQTHPASIYSFVENKVVKSDKRKSEKKSFRDDIVESICSTHLIPLIKSLLESIYPSNEYNITVGSQHFDYIKYDSGGYFEPHRDFTRINSKQHQQYTVIIGLSQIKSLSSGHTILWFPVDSTNLMDWEDLTNPLTESKHLYSKYQIPSWYNKNRIIEIFEENITINKFLPIFFSTLHTGNVLAFKSSLVHSGEKFYSNESAKELLTITINISCIENNVNPDYKLNLNSNSIILFDEYKSFIDCNNIIPFQIILCSGEYNDKKFIDKYLRFWNLDKSIYTPSNLTITQGISLSLEEIYQDTKKN